MELRKDRDGSFRDKQFARFNHRCCFIPTMVPTWKEFSKLSEHDKQEQCNNTSSDSKLMLYRKDGDLNNNTDDNILVLCKYHYGVMFNELRTKIKNLDQKKRGIRAEKRKVVTISPEDFRKLVSYISNPQHLMLIQSFYYLGARANELVMLKKEDITFNKLNSAIRFKAENTKRKVERFVPIPANMLEPFKIYTRNLKDEDRLFDFTPQRAWQIVKIYVKKSKLDINIHPHTFRHSYATAIYDKIGDLKVVQDLLGHKNLATTSIYAHTSDAHKRDVINKTFGK